MKFNAVNKNQNYKTQGNVLQFEVSKQESSKIENTKQITIEKIKE